MNGFRWLLACSLMVATQTGLAQEREWGGAYVGGIIGHAFQPDDDDERIEFDTNLDGAFGDTVNTSAPANAFSPGFCGGRIDGLSPGECPDDEGAAEFGLRAGFDWVVGTWVIGAVGDLSFSDVDDAVSAFSIAPARYTMVRELNWLIGARLRGGYVLPNDLLVYGTGGIAWADMDHYLASTDSASAFVERNGDRGTGVQFGLGVEWKLGRNWRLSGEYLHTNLDDDDYRIRASEPARSSFSLVNASGTDFRRTEDRFNLNTFRVAFSYQFDDFF